MHLLKTKNPYFYEAWVGNKTFEIRHNDRNFKTGDRILLLEYDHLWPTDRRAILAEITYIYDGGLFGLPDNLCVFSFKTIKNIRNGQYRHEISQADYQAWLERGSIGDTDPFLHLIKYPT